MTNPTELLPKYDLMIKKAAWRVVRNYGLDFQDALQEAYVIFLESCERYDDHQAAFSTFLHYRLRALNTGRPLIRNELKAARTASDGETALGYVADDRDELSRLISELTFVQEAQRLSDDALEVLDWTLGERWVSKPSGAPQGARALPTAKAVTFAFGTRRHWAATRTLDAWEEVRAWWRSVSPDLLSA